MRYDVNCTAVHPLSRRSDSATMQRRRGMNVDMFWRELVADINLMSF